jgi:hypothetical protein
MIADFQVGNGGRARCREQRECRVRADGKADTSGPPLACPASLDTLPPLRETREKALHLRPTRSSALAPPARRALLRTTIPPENRLPLVRIML